MSAVQNLLTLLMQQLHPSVSSHLYQVGQLLSVVILKIQVLFDSEFKAFITAIPYNFYAILSLLMVFLLCVFSLDFGPMAKHEVLAERGFLGGLDEQKDSLAQLKSGRVADYGLFQFLYSL